jgi:hypothetical protein
MASGRLGKASLTANNDTDLYAVPAGTVATVNVNLCNTGSTTAKVRLAVRSGALAAPDYIEYDAEIPANGVLERTGIVLGAGETVVARSSTAGVSARVHGFEEAN